MTIFDKKVVISATLAGLLTFGVCTYIQHEKQQVDWVHCSLEASIGAGELWEKVSYCEGEIIHTRHNTVSWGSTESNTQYYIDKWEQKKNMSHTSNQTIFVHILMENII